MNRLALVGLLLLVPAVALADSSGIAGYSGMAKTNCTSCHKGLGFQNAMITGPTFLKVGATGTYTFTLYASYLAKMGGLDVAASGGTLSKNVGEPNTKLLNKELVHSTPKTLGAGTFTLSWTFDWTAPKVVGSYTLYAAGLGANGNKLDTGDVTGAAQRAVMVGSCQTNKECDDKNKCTTDICNPLTKQCTNNKILNCCLANTDCTDANPCTTDACNKSNYCTHVPKPDCCLNDSVCQDLHYCTKDACDPATNKCTNTKLTGCCSPTEPCNDNNKCTTDSCNFAAHTCTFKPTPNCCKSNADCDDKNACTTDACDTTSGLCSNTSKPNCCLTAADCDDKEVCTSDTCNKNVCGNTKVTGCCKSTADCDDSNPCTTDACVVLTHTCSHKAVANCTPPDGGSPTDTGAGDGPGPAGDGPGPAGDGPGPSGDGPGPAGDGQITTGDGNPTTGDSSGVTPPTEDDGCCRVGQARHGVSIVPLLLLGLVLLLALRSRRDR